MLTPAETQALFATLQKLVARGLSDHLHLAQAQRGDGGQPTACWCCARASWPASGATGETSRAGAGRVDGRPRGRSPSPTVEPRGAGEALLELSGVTVAGAAARRARRRRPGVARRRDHRHCRRVGQWPGGACRLVIAGTERRAAGRLRHRRRRRRCAGRRARRSTRGIARIPEDRHAVGTDRRHERHRKRRRRALSRSPRFSRRGLLDWGAARSFAETVIRELRRAAARRRTPPVRLLSGGNMQKLILGRVPSIADPASSSPISRRAASTSARWPMSTAQLIEARDARRGDAADLRGSRRDHGAVRPDRGHVQGPPVGAGSARRTLGRQHSAP